MSGCVMDGRGSLFSFQLQKREINDKGGGDICVRRDVM